MYQEEYTLSISYLNKAFKFATKSNTIYDLFNLNIRVAELYQNTDKNEIALNYLNNANKIKEKNNLLIQESFILDLRYAEAYQGEKKFKEACNYYQKTVYEIDTIQLINNTKSALEYQTKYETLEKEKQILQLSSAAKIQHLKLAQQHKQKTQLLWFALCAILVIVTLGILAYWLRNSIQKLNVLNAQIRANTKALTQQAGIISKYQSQMNPHFVFNALNSIQGLLRNNEVPLATTQISHFSGLMRKTLNNSEHDYLTLDKELAYLSEYVQFEQNNATFTLNFNANVDTAIDAENTLLPPMLLQPFIENCIKHAGFDALNNASITLHITLINHELMQITITDNGKGLSTTSNNSTTKPQSKAIRIAQERLQLCFATHNIMPPLHYLTIANSTIHTGVCVTLQMPYLQKF
jgi:LytS/YehU family sensor histidine kinase